MDQKTLNAFHIDHLRKPHYTVRMPLDVYLKKSAKEAILVTSAWIDGLTNNRTLCVVTCIVCHRHRILTNHRIAPPYCYNKYDPKRSLQGLVLKKYLHGSPVRRNMSWNAWARLLYVKYRYNEQQR